MGSRVAGNWSEEGDPRILAPEGSQERGCARVICAELIIYFVSRGVVLCVCSVLFVNICYSIYLRAEIGRSSARRPRRPGAGARGAT